MLIIIRIDTTSTYGRVIGDVDGIIHCCICTGNIHTAANKRTCVTGNIHIRHRKRAVFNIKAGTLPPYNISTVAVWFFCSRIVSITTTNIIGDIHTFQG